MPRIDPIQLLNCLSVLLSTNGGIKSRDEVQRLASLMTKFSKKLVSKCIYIQILKRTETELLGLFMGSGGWRLVHMWLTESIVAKNWPLVRELLELLLLCPVDIERLKTNNCPKLVKELSKDGNYFAIRALASKLVEQWLKTVKGEHVIPVGVDEIPRIVENAGFENNVDVIKTEGDPGAELEEKELEKKLSDVKTENSDTNAEQKSVDTVNTITQIRDETETEPETLPVLKITVKDGKQIISQVNDNDIKPVMSPDKEKSRDKHKSKSKEKSLDRSSTNNSSSRSSSSKHSSKSHSSSSDKHKSSHKDSSSRHSSKDRTKDKDKRSSSSSKSKSNDDNKKSADKSSSSSRSKDEKRSSKHSSDKDKSRDKSKEDKNRDSSHKSDSKTPSISKLGRIPKIGDVKKEKPSISIEVRKPDDPKPKTVKTFHSKFRKHGLEEEIKPPPSRASLLNKKPPIMPSTIPVIPKRPSPVHNDTPPEKKLKPMEAIEKPGAIKLIPPKPKPMMLLESDMFMDALNASATNKKEPKKRKRRTSGSKDTPSEGSPPHTPTTTSPIAESKSVPPRFYQDTLDTEEGKEKDPEKSEANENKDENKIESPKDNEEPMDTTETHTLTVNGLKGVLCYHKRKGPKKSIKWKPDTELEDIQYFELDETERVNVTKTFTDMKHLERVHERQVFQKARNLSTVDVMEEKTNWRPLILVHTGGQIQVEYGKNSKEKEIQAVRQKGISSLYFLKTMVPDSPTEPEVETHTFSEPVIIPLEDVTGNQDNNTGDFRDVPWPEPKGNAPPAGSNVNASSMFPPNITQFPNNFPSPFPPGGPGFPGPNMMPGDWQPGITPHMMPNGMPGPMNPSVMPPGAIPPINMPPGMMVPPEGMMMGPEMYGAPNPMFPVPPDGFNVPPNMFPPDFNNMPGLQRMPGPDGFSAPNNMRGGMRGRGAPGHWRGKSNWEGQQRGRGGSARGGRKTVCIYFQRKGSCRQGDSCTFLHPGVNCPF